MQVHRRRPVTMGLTLKRRAMISKGVCSYRTSSQQAFSSRAGTRNSAAARSHHDSMSCDGREARSASVSTLSPNQMCPSSWIRVNIWADFASAPLTNIRGAYSPLSAKPRNSSTLSLRCVLFSTMPLITAMTPRRSTARRSSPTASCHVRIVAAQPASRPTMRRISRPTASDRLPDGRFPQTPGAPPRIRSTPREATPDAAASDRSCQEDPGSGGGLSCSILSASPESEVVLPGAPEGTGIPPEQTSPSRTPPVA
jgi:hypothetical protein